MFLDQKRDGRKNLFYNSEIQNELFFKFCYLFVPYDFGMLIM